MNDFRVAGNSQTISFEVVGEDLRVLLTHREGVHLAGWLLGTVLLQSPLDKQGVEDLVDRFRTAVREASGRRSPV
jgi:hypothetical protein